MPSFSRGVFFLLVLLTAALPLCCSATLDAEERQKEQQERDAIKEDARKDDMAPEPPQDLVVDVQSDIVVLLLWKEPSDTADLHHYFVYVEGEDMEDTSATTNYIWNNLEACKNYTFGVRSVSTSGDMSEPELGDGRTNVGSPPPPQNLQGESESSTSMALTWDKPDTLCDIEYYRVKWGLDETYPGTTQVAETSYTVPNLLPNTTYFLSVSAITSEGEGDAATIQETTAESEGGPPEDLVAVGISTSAINSSWSPPSSKPPEYYTVQGPPCMYMEEKVLGLSYLFKDLDPCESCTIVVTSIYDNDHEYTTSTLGKTLSGDPPPPESCSVEVQDDYLIVSWVAPESKCPLEKYNVLWTSTKLWGDGEEDSGSVNTTVLQLDITEPVPYSDYSFEIFASIDGVFGSPASCSGTSSEALPGPPVNVKVDLEQSAVLVNWDTPAEENGLIKNYGIYVDEGIDPVMQVAGNEHSARVGLEDLEPCVNVSLTVKAFNGAGWGSSSEAKYVTVMGDVLPEEVDCSSDDLEVKVCWLPYSESCPVSRYNLKWEGDVLWSDDLVDSDNTTMEWSPTEACYSISALPYTKYSVELTVGSGDEGVKCSAVTPMAAPGPPAEVNLATEGTVITVTWSEPERKNGIIDFYQVQWEDSAGDIGSHTTDDNSTFSSEIQEASCGVTVNVIVSAKVVTVAELGDASPPVTGYVVNSIKTMNCESSEPGQVSLTWTLEDPECPVGFYNLTWTYDSLWSDDTGEGSQNVEKDDISTLVTSLPPYSIVSLQIHVDNNAKYTDCSVTTPEEAPGPPTEVNITTESIVITVTWSEPKEKNGIIAFYQVEWDDSAGGPGSFTTDDNSTFSSEIQGVSCGATVDVMVRAKVVTVAELGDASPPVTAYPVNSVKTLKCESSKPGEVSLGWTLEFADCPVEFYNLTWTYDSLWSEDAGDGWEKIGKDDVSATMTSLPAYSNVVLQMHVNNKTEYTDCSAITPQEASSKPQSVKQIASSTSSVTVAWGQPLFIRGILNGWRLRCETMNGDLIQEDVTDPEDMTYNITELSSSSSYAVYVMAINGAGDGEAEKINVITAYIGDHGSSPSNTGLIIGLSVGGGILLILLMVGGFILYRKKGSSKHLESASYTPEVADADNDELYKMQHLSSANHQFQNKSGSVDLGTDSELYTNPRPSLSKHELDAGNDIPSANDRGPMFGAPPNRRFSQQVASNLPRLGAYSRRPSQQVNSRMRNYEEYSRRPSQQDMIGRPSLSGGPGRPPSGEYGRRPSQQTDVGRPNMKENGRRPSQQVDLGRPNLMEYGRRPSQQADIGRPISGEFARRPSQQVPAVGGSFPTRHPQQGPSKRSSVDLYSRRPSQQADHARPGDRMLMKRPSQQFVMSFEGIQEL